MHTLALFHASASNEQSAGIEQVNQAVIQMDEVTQQNAALVEEAAAAAEAMQEQAGTPMEVVSIFKLDGGSGNTRISAAKLVGTQPNAGLASQHHATIALTPVRDDKLLSGHPKERKLAEAKEDRDGEWKEF